MIIGARIIKTGIAVTITMFICKALQLEPAIFGAVSAVINMQPSLHLTFKTAKDQILVHVLGVTAGLATGYLMGGNPPSMGLTTVLIIALYRKMKLQSSVLMGIVAAIFILGSSPDQFLSHAFSRSAVIFIGLSVALVVNMVLWPPRYGTFFIEKLRESNDQAASYFCQAVYDFVGLEDREVHSSPSQKEKVQALNQESRVLLEHYRRERKQDSDPFGPVDQDHWLQRAVKLIEYSEALQEKANRIYELLPARLERRLKSGAPPISQEFQSILELLESGCTTVQRVNDKLRTQICSWKPVEKEEISEAYWEKLTEALEQWQPKITGSYYLHALLEVAVVANEIRWVTREGKKLINAGLIKLDLLK